VRAAPALALALGAALALAGCGGTTDSLGYNRLAGRDVRRLSGPATYPSAFRDLLGKSDAEIATKIEAVFAQLFHGDPSTQAIYVPVGADQAYVQDVLHGDIRTEGIGYGMIVAVELNKRDEHDRLWTYAKKVLQRTSGPEQGYFNSRCEVAALGMPPAMDCLDPFGFEQILTALLFANDRWGSAPGAIDYASEAATLFNVMRLKEQDNGGVVGGVTDMFDAKSRLAFDVPSMAAATYTRPAVAMPAYYELWRQATGDPFWTAAAASARAYLRDAAHPTTGLEPARAFFDGTPLSGWDVFVPESYRAQINMALDRIWFGVDPWQVSEADSLLQFFSAQGLDKYCQSYSLDGTSCLEPTHILALIAANGVTAAVADAGDRTSFVSAVWNMTTPTGSVRYYSGILQLVALLVLGGQYRIW
jgi:oligosaccharide reducing-end xylanase